MAAEGRTTPTVNNVHHAVCGVVVWRHNELRVNSDFSVVEDRCDFVAVQRGQVCSVASRECLGHELRRVDRSRNNL